MDKKKYLYVEQVRLKNFRCFTDLTMRFDTPLSVFTGGNGIGKTSLVEALYYGCYLRSFRAGFTKEIIRHDNNAFFVQLTLSSGDVISAGFSKNKRHIKINEKQITSHRALMEHYRAVILIEDDIDLIRGYPSARRNFIDHQLIITGGMSIELLKDFNLLVQQRTALLQKSSIIDLEMYRSWTKQLWKKSIEVRALRIKELQYVERAVNKLIQEYFSQLDPIVIRYAEKNEYDADDWKTFCNKYERVLLEKEKRIKRTSFGAQLDDFAIAFQSQYARKYASRGQQKLLVTLIKVVQIMRLAEQKSPIIFLLDDFMTDFDEIVVERLFVIIHKLPCQVIFTTPLSNGILNQQIERSGGTSIDIDDYQQQLNKKDTIKDNIL